MNRAVGNEDGRSKLLSARDREWVVETAVDVSRFIVGV
jgi:hypothetical protein